MQDGIDPEKDVEDITAITLWNRDITSIYQASEAAHWSPEVARSSSKTDRDLESQILSGSDPWRQLFIILTVSKLGLFKNKSGGMVPVKLL
jgi:hypothetical protein